MNQRNKPKLSPIREQIHEIIFEADTPAGKGFDIGLLILILASVLVVMLESVDRINEQYEEVFRAMEWIFTGLFTVEYLLRLYCVHRPMRYATSFFGIIDLLAILPTYLSIFFAGTQYLLVIRGLRLLRIFRIFKLGHFMSEGEIIIKAMRASRAKITVFLFFILLVVIIIGSVMYLVEGGQNPAFTSIPRSIYWTIVTLTTVGFGDITPQTELGQFLSAIIMILGYAVIAVPTGIVSAEFIESQRKDYIDTRSCRSCGNEGHDADASHCKYCGSELPND